MESFQLPIRTLSSLMKALGHTKIDVLKLDVEGSEFAMLNEMLDNGCPPVDQITTEWHHHSFDSRYMLGSSPPINAINTLLDACGLKQFYLHKDGGWRSPGADYLLRGMHDVRYNLAGWKRVRSAGADAHAGG